MSRRAIALLVSAVSCLALVIVIPCPGQAQELTWEQIGERGFGDSNTRVASMTVFNDSLYAGTLNQVEKCQVWRYDGGTNWTQVNQGGFGGSSMAVQCLAVFDAELYAGTTDWVEGCQVWRYDSGTSWTQVNEAGFGSINNKMVTSMTVLGALLCAGTDNKTDYCQVWGAVPEPLSLILILVLGSGFGVHFTRRRSDS